MPRKDRTFSDRDILRLVFNYLDREEKIKVLEFFGLGLDLPPPPPKEELPKKKVQTIKIEVEIATKTLEIVQGLVKAASFAPGPQKALLQLIEKSLGVVLTSLKIIDRVIL